MILFHVLVLCFPSLVDGHGYMSIPAARTGDDRSNGLRSPKLQPWANYRTVIDGDATGCYGPTGAGNAEQFPRSTFKANRMQVTPGVPFMVEWDIRLGHQAPLNHLRIARTYTIDAEGATTTTSNFADGILFNEEDTAADKAQEQSPTFSKYLTTQKHNTMVTLPSETAAGLAELQWVWASERDGPGGYYISCANIEIMGGGGGGVGGGLTSPTPPPTPMNTPPPSDGGVNSLTCYSGKGDSKVETVCQAPLNDRCMTTWVNNEYYHRCANMDFCIAAKQSAINEGRQADGQTFQRALTSLECCSIDRCNSAGLVTLPPGINASVKSITTLGLIFGLLHLLL